MQTSTQLDIPLFRRRLQYRPQPALYAEAGKVYVAALAAIEGTIKRLSEEATNQASELGEHGIDRV